MKKGFQLLRPRQIYGSILNGSVIPESYLTIARYFELGELSFTIDNVRKDGTDFDIPLTNVKYQKYGILFGLEFLYSPSQIDSMLDAGERLDDPFSKDKKLKIAHFVSPSNSHLYLGISDETRGQVFAGHFLAENRKYINLESDIHHFINNLHLSENQYQLNDKTRDRIFKNWGEKNWSIMRL